MNIHSFGVWLKVLLAVLVLAAWPSGQVTAEDTLWESGLRSAYFGERPIADGSEVIDLEAPERSENPALVPVRITARIPQSPERYIRTITLLIDKNPDPLAGVFEFTPRSGKADLGLRVRVNEYSTLRAIAETSDGKLYMVERFVKASGGCSAPVGTDLDAARARLGKMRFKTIDAGSADAPQQLQLMISHPNVTGLQMDQVTLLTIPAHFVQKVAVTLDDQPVLTAKVGITMSENPSFRFYVQPDGPGTLRATVEDSEGDTFTQTLQIVPGASDAAHAG